MFKAQNSCYVFCQPYYNIPIIIFLTSVRYYAFFAQNNRIHLLKFQIKYDNKIIIVRIKRTILSIVYTIYFL